MNLKNSSKLFYLSHQFSTKAKWPFIEIPYARTSLLSFLWSGGPKMLHKKIDRLHAKHGPAFYKISLDGIRVLFISDPELNMQVMRCEGKYPVHIVPESWKLSLTDLKMKRGLFFMDGSEWKKNRLIMNNIMGGYKSYDKLLPTLNMTANHLVDAWKEKLPSGKTLERDLHKWSTETTTLSFVGATFGSNKLEGKYGSIPDEFLDASYAIFKRSVYFSTFPPILTKTLFIFTWKRFLKSVETSLNMGKDIVDCGMANNRGQIMSYPSFLEDMMKHQQLNEDTIYRIIIDMIITAGDTGGATILWVLYVLGRNQEVLKKCQNEVKEVLGDKQAFDLDDIEQMRYLGCVLKETMRLYPVAPFITRLTNSDLTHNQYYIPEKTMVATSLFTMQRDEKTFNDPHSFIPERWSRDIPPEDKEKRAKMSKAVLPFGYGARSCIAKHLSKIQTTIVVAHLLLNFNWQVTRDVKPKLQMITIPSKNLKLNIQVKDRKVIQK